jgi:hypothetical protein
MVHYSPVNPSNPVLETNLGLVGYSGVIIGIANIAIGALIIALLVRKMRGQIQLS